MIHEPELLIDRQFKYLLSREGAEFFLQAGRCLRVLEGEPRLAGLLQELRREADDLEHRRAEQDARDVSRLVELKRKFLAQAPGADDSSTPETDPLPPEWFETLAAFDAIASGRKEPNRAGDGTRSDALLRLLDRKISALRTPPGAKSDQRPDLAGLALELLNFREEHDHWIQALKAEIATSPGVALHSLEAILAVINPAPVASPSQSEWYKRAFAEVWSGKQAFRSAVFGEGNVEPLLKPLSKAKPFAEQLYEGLRLKLGARRSALALLRRFKTRCQVHDRRRLEAMADREDELALTAELALWLFDEGFNPITDVPIAGIRPDILDASRDPGAALYIEAKQYKKGDAIRHRIQLAMYQVYTSVGRLRGDHLDVTEAFLVIFRRSGPFVHLPEEISAGDYVVFPILVDIAPAQETGSRERLRPIEITIDDLRPAAVELAARSVERPRRLSSSGRRQRRKNRSGSAKEK